MPELKVIFFDIDDTLYSTTEFTRKARYKAIDEMIRVGLEIDRDTCYEALEEIVGEFSSNDSHLFDKLLHRLPDESKTKANEIVTVAAGISGYHNTKFTDLKPFPDVKECMPRIASLPVRIGIISSGIALKQAEKVLRLKLETFFDPLLIFISEAVGIGKNNYKIFEHACRKARVKPAEAMHVGDNPATDIDIAHEAGLITVLREGAGKHAHDPARFEPDYRIRTFNDLCTILEKDFGLSCA